MTRSGSRSTRRHLVRALVWGTRGAAHMPKSERMDGHPCTHLPAPLRPRRARWSSQALAWLLVGRPFFKSLSLTPGTCPASRMAVAYGKKQRGREDDDNVRISRPLSFPSLPLGERRVKQVRQRRLPAQLTPYHSSSSSHSISLLQDARFLAAVVRFYPLASVTLHSTI